MSIDAVVLAGGRGTRLASVVSDVPKPLAPVDGKPFLNYLLAGFVAGGVVGRVVLAIGHLADRVVAHYAATPPALPLDYSIETTPLGTGGALVAAWPRVRGRRAIVANGDSLVASDHRALLDHHVLSGALVTMTLVEVPDTARYGAVTLADDPAARPGTGRVSAFHEKSAIGGIGLINAGLYLIEAEAIAALPDGPLSLERDVLPVLVAAGRVQAVVTRGPFLDIGLPETYAAAPAFLAGLGMATGGTGR
ncbi:MAG TPA: sugar phosphate nucleotidyltransferase [Stellaceae bacterium]|nr:sugar phosphate nucleotidyltransferase [Stellaceae bacterium]